MARHGGDDLLRCTVGAVVEGVEIKHHNLIAGFGECFLLVWEDESVGRSEETGMEDAISKSHVCHEIFLI